MQDDKDLTFLDFIYKNKSIKLGTPDSRLKVVSVLSKKKIISPNQDQQKILSLVLANERIIPRTYVFQSYPKSGKTLSYFITIILTLNMKENKKFKALIISKNPDSLESIYNSYDKVFGNEFSDVIHIKKMSKDDKWDDNCNVILATPNKVAEFDERRGGYSLKKKLKDIRLFIIDGAEALLAEGTADFTCLSRIFSAICNRAPIFMFSSKFQQSAKFNINKYFTKIGHKEPVFMYFRPKESPKLGTLSGYTISKVIKEKDSNKYLLGIDHETKQRVFIKQIDLSGFSDEEKQAIFDEEVLVSTFTHPNIVKHRHPIIEYNYLFIIQDYCDTGTLKEKLDKFKGSALEEELVMFWFVQICLAVSYLFRNKYIHRDIQLKNIFLMSNGMLKLAGFENSFIQNANISKMTEAILTSTGILSPELCNGKNYTHKTDIWELGVLLYELCSLRSPFIAKSIPVLIHKILRTNPAPIPYVYSSDLRLLVESMLSKQPSKRPHISEIMSYDYIKERIKFLIDMKPIKLNQNDHARRMSNGRVLDKRPVSAAKYEYVIPKFRLQKNLKREGVLTENGIRDIGRKEYELTVFKHKEIDRGNIGKRRSSYADITRRGFNQRLSPQKDIEQRSGSKREFEPSIPVRMGYDNEEGELVGLGYAENPQIDTEPEHGLDMAHVYTLNDGDFNKLEKDVPTEANSEEDFKSYIKTRVDHYKEEMFRSKHPEFFVDIDEAPPKQTVFNLSDLIHLSDIDTTNDTFESLADIAKDIFEDDKSTDSHEDSDSEISSNQTCNLFGCITPLGVDQKSSTSEAEKLRFELEKELGVEKLVAAIKCLEKVDDSISQVELEEKLCKILTTPHEFSLYPSIVTLIQNSS